MFWEGSTKVRVSIETVPLMEVRGEQGECSDSWSARELREGRERSDTGSLEII